MKTEEKFRMKLKISMVMRQGRVCQMYFLQVNKFVMWREPSWHLFEGGWLLKSGRHMVWS